MSLTPASTTFPTVREFLDQFSQSVSYVDEVASGDPEGGSSTTPATINSVTSSLSDAGVTIHYAGNTVTISGHYTEAFKNKTWEYVPYQHPEQKISGAFYQDIPEKIDSLISFNPEKTVQTTVTYTVNTDAGSATITQTVRNDWDAGKAQLFAVKARGAY